MSILVVEKNNESSELIYEIFNKEKKDLFFVCDGAQALVAFRKYKISIVIIDLKISFVNALDLIQIMKIENPQIKVIALNSSSNNYDIDKYEENYCFDILIRKNDINKYLYDAYLELITFKLNKADLNESLINLELFQKAFETNSKLIK